jgi:hypothetical protein
MVQKAGKAPKARMMRLQMSDIAYYDVLSAKNAELCIKFIFPMDRDVQR